MRADFDRDDPALRAIARNRCPSGADDDALQDTYLALATRPPTGGQGSLRRWLIAVLLNFCRMAHRRARRFVGGDTDDAMLPRVEQIVDVRTAVVGELARLAPLDAEIVMRRDVAGASTAEVARHLGLTPIAVRVRLHRAHQRLRTQLSAPD